MAFGAPRDSACWDSEHSAHSAQREKREGLSATDSERSAEQLEPKADGEDRDCLAQKEEHRSMRHWRLEHQANHQEDHHKEQQERNTK
jgi:hypothetical protein